MLFNTFKMKSQVPKLFSRWRKKSICAISPLKSCKSYNNHLKPQQPHFTLHKFYSLLNNNVKGKKLLKLAFSIFIVITCLFIGLDISFSTVLLQKMLLSLKMLGHNYQLIKFITSNSLVDTNNLF